RGERDPGDHGDHRDTEDDDDAIHGYAGPLAEEDGHGDEGGDCTADLGVDPQHRVDPEGGAPDVPDVEDEPAEDDECRQDVPQPGEDRVGQVLGTQPRDADDAPDVQLHADVDDDGDED